jgi:hypothetical protein
VHWVYFLNDLRQNHQCNSTVFVVVTFCRAAIARQLHHCHNSTVVLWLGQKCGRAPRRYCLNIA